jgi:WD40 repeat protein
MWHVELPDKTFPRMVMSADDMFLALCGTADRVIQIFEVQSGQLYATLDSTVRDYAVQVSFHCDSKQIAFVSFGGVAELWDLDSRTHIWTSDAIAGIFSHAPYVVFSPRSDLLACINMCYLTLLDAVSGETDFRLDGSFTFGILYYTNVAWAADGTRLLTHDDEGCVCVWDVVTEDAAHAYVRNFVHTVDSQVTPKEPG